MNAIYCDVGSVVRVKSGGPEMTIADETEDGELVCVWFDGGDMRVGKFEMAVLQMRGFDYGIDGKRMGFLD